MQARSRFSRVIAPVCLLLNAVMVLSAANAEEPRFVYVEEGTLDTATGLVWGHSLDGVNSWAGGGTSYSWAWVMEGMWVRNPEDPEGWISYQEFSNILYGREDTDWRVPTESELLDAVNAGLVDYVDLSPYEGVQIWTDLYPAGVHSGVYSSTKGGPQRDGGKGVVVDLFTAETRWLGCCLTQGTIPVRGAPPADGGGGGGKGKGGKK